LVNHHNPFENAQLDRLFDFTQARRSWPESQPCIPTHNAWVCFAPDASSGFNGRICSTEISQ